MLDVRDLSITWDGFAVRDVSFSVAAGDYFVLLGPSGGGKTVVLEVLAGLLHADSGRIHLDGREVTRERIQNRGFALVYQDQALFPHMTVRQNIAYGLHGRRLAAPALAQEVEALAGQVGVSGLLGRSPQTLSGGEAQRVALARALARRPRCLLLDEPISALDITARAEMRALLRRLHREGHTFVHVTHDFEEAVSLATRVAIIVNGRIVQAGTRAEVFSQPRSEFVARFTGVDNFFHGTLEGTGDGLARFRTPGAEFLVPDPGRQGAGYLMFRRRDVRVEVPPAATALPPNSFCGRIVDVAPTRSGLEVQVEAGIRLAAHVPERKIADLPLDLGQEVVVTLKEGMGRFVEENN